MAVTRYARRSGRTAAIGSLFGNVREYVCIVLPIGVAVGVEVRADEAVVDTLTDAGTGAGDGDAGGLG